MENVHVGRTLAVLLLGAFISILNQTLINIALPHLMTDFNISATTAQWLSTAYMLVNGVLIPVTAFLIATYGTRKLFNIAMGFFTIGSIVCAITPNFSILLIGRILQAVGAGILMPLVMSVFLTVFPPEKRGTAMGTMGIAMIFAPAVGPTLAGWIVEHYTWRILFIMMIPLGVIDIVLASRWLKNVVKLTFPKFDAWGAVTSTLGFGGLLYGFSDAGTKGWSSLTVVGFMIIGAIFIAIFIWRELTVDQPLLEMRVFKYNIFTLTTIIGASINLTMFGGMILLPIYLQNIRGFTPLQSGLLMLPGALLMGVMSPISGALFDRIGARPLAVIGLIITAFTTWEFSKLTSDSTYNHILLMYTARMFGMSFMMMTVQTAGLNQIPLRLASHATAMSNTTRQIAGSIGTALLVTVMTTRTTMHMGDYGNVVTSSQPQIVSMLQGLSAGLASMAGIPEQAGQSLALQSLYGIAMKESTIKGINDAFLVATLFALIALVLSFFISRAKKDTVEVLRQHPAELTDRIIVEPAKP
ncbi:DHA2 family efflux MFS transporter permease subunit [Paenibacillus frigoriresistens]|uniref:DHA2 family efflux MFS transporter permease subunit n=1 Tax=Paenibacillus alginolyticus TaxID=59839 RepID=UPI0015668E3A|nr:DHA2 family efflux MFS transporter permease subunit [Paenibacillus frigoriresistens]NRF93518.1 DHA2 family efflux MFS transporter permease subunit [Paenibacillus frigoriresistens]